MKIQVKQESEGLELVELQGDLDFHCSPELREALSKLVDRQASKILIDLKQVGYVDSSGLATFVELFQKMKRYGGKLVLFNLTQSVRSVFEIAKLDSIFKLAQNREEALTLAQ
ncbi:MAG: STAS domain-containing protein [Candidatus Omnitrophica bacterium]|nr:STAS domain-containing protein [Candidatus Omnitrophota bacterium]